MKDKLYHRYLCMLREQEKIKPFVLTLRELQDVFAVNTTSAVVYILNQLIKEGLVITRNSHYYAVRKSDEIKNKIRQAIP